MKKIRAGIFLPILLLVFSSHRVPVQNNTIDPVGEYQFTSSDDGQSFTADLIVEGEPGNYQGIVSRKDRNIEIAFKDVGVNGDKMIIVADVRNSVFVLRLYFSGESFTGNWSLGNDGNELKGKRLK